MDLQPRSAEWAGGAGVDILRHSVLRDFRCLLPSRTGATPHNNRAPAATRPSSQPARELVDFGKRRWLKRKGDAVGKKSEGPVRSPQNVSGQRENEWAVVESVVENASTAVVWNLPQTQPETIDTTTIPMKVED